MLSPNKLEVKVYLLCSGVLCLKMLFMALFVGKLRLKKEIFISPEDAVRRGKVAYDDPDIERVRRAHLNDLENIPIFLASGAMYLATSPHRLLASALFLSYTAARMWHTYVYAVRVRPQPARMTAFRVGYIVNICIIALTLVNTVFYKGLNMTDLTGDTFSNVFIFFCFVSLPNRVDNPDSWGIVELQGDLESRIDAPLQSQFIGDLHYGMQSNGVPTLIVGHHMLYGKAVPLEKPYAIMEKKRNNETTEYIIKALVDRKLVFRIRPKPIIASVPGL